MSNNQYTSLDWLDKLIDEIPELADAYEYGIDVEMLVSNVRRPVEERIRRHQIALDTFNMLKGAKKA